VSLGWSFGDGTAVGANPSHVFLAPGPHVVTVTATDAAGNATSQSGVVIVSAPPSGNLRPVLSKLLETHSVFRVGARPTAVAAAKRRRAPIGTTFRFSLNEPAIVTITFTRATTGRRSGHRCVKPTKRLAHSKRCTRFVNLRALTRHGGAGTNSVAFSGRIARRALPPGTYRATFLASAGNMSSVPKVLRFKIVR
jgi:PKD repeat protein